MTLMTLLWVRLMNLEQINIFDEHAVVVDGYGEFSGLDRDQAREAIVAGLKSMACLIMLKTLITLLCIATAAAQLLSRGSLSSGLLPLISSKSLQHR